MPRWIHSFLLCLQATKEILERFYLLPPLRRRFEIKQDANVFSVAEDLLNIDIVFPVQIAWIREGESYAF